MNCNILQNMYIYLYVLIKVIVEFQDSYPTNIVSLFGSRDLFDMIISRLYRRCEIIEGNKKTTVGLYIFKNN